MNVKFSITTLIKGSSENGIHILTVQEGNGGKLLSTG